MCVSTCVVNLKLNKKDSHLLFLLERGREELYNSDHKKKKKLGMVDFIVIIYQSYTRFLMMQKPAFM